MSSTRDRILDAASALIARQPDDVPSMSAVARATGISRQALYLHFPDRAALLLAVVGHVDEREGLAEEIAGVQAAPDGPAQVRAWVEMQARRNPRIAPLARALDQARHGDEEATVAWRDRTDSRLRGASAIARRLRQEGHVHRSWTATEAAALVWELVSFRVWDDLVNQAGLAPARYADIATTSVLAALAAPVRRSRPRATQPHSHAASPGPAAADVVAVRERGRELHFTFDEVARFHGRGSPGGVAIAFRALQLAAGPLAAGGPVERRDVHVRTAFGGPGARDGFEAVLRAVSDGRYFVDPSLTRPALGPARERFVFVLASGSATTTLVLRPGYASDELVTLAGTDPRTPQQEARLTAVKDELCSRVMERPADEVFDVE